MSKIKLKNVSSVSLGLPNIGFHAPGVEFSVDAIGKEPAHVFWRKRLKEGAIQIVTAAPPPKPAAKSDASEAKSTKKGS